MYSTSLLNKSRVIWFTGLSGAGKTTLAKKLFNYLSLKEKKVIILDGDTIRSETHKDLDFSPDGIKKNNELITELCIGHLREFDYVIVSVIAPFAESRKEARGVLGEAYTEVFVKASLETLIERDTKKLYKKALKGDIQNFIGIDPNVPYQIPENSDIIIETENENEEKSFENLLEKLFN